MLHSNAVRLTEFLISHGSIDTRKRPILVYGCELALSTLTSFASIAVISIFIQDFISSLLFIAIFFFLRLFSGGFHASTYTRCFIITAFLETEGARHGQYQQRGHQHQRGPSHGDPGDRPAKPLSGCLRPVRP